MVQSNIILGATALISSMSSVALAFPVKEKGYDHMALEASLNNAGEDNKKLNARAEGEQAFSSAETLTRTDSMAALENLSNKYDNASTDQKLVDIASTFDHDHDHKHFDLDDYIIMAIKEHIKQHQAQQATAQAQRAQSAQAAQASKLNARDETSSSDSESTDSDSAATFDHDHKHFDLDDYIIMVIKDSIKQHQAQQAAAQAQRIQTSQATQASKLNARDETSSSDSESAEVDSAATFDHDHKHFDLDDYIILMIKESIKQHQAQHQAQVAAQQAQKASQQAQAVNLKLLL
ncbi:uncharacterized protein SAPINGB_P001289 [Magnusiomyces paraingens]|uniref:Uncharacterized protein n=1 Tax=Magnusiomyces paraingens TaxID=2606893 RepID=A0A5E8B4Y1_9ASCO|nr:uncharacterized protein SAPINGB_P001289 [Saprochaete ingens]VVT46590.1 unnamed protein product [Saprochaete ingens]